MSKKVLGVYNSSDEVIQAIGEFQNQGYSVGDLSIIANTADFPASVQNETGVTPEVTGDHNGLHEHKGIIASLVSAFEDKPGETSYSDQLVGLGIDQAAAREYENDINSGKILLLVDNSADPMSGYSIASTANDEITTGRDTLSIDGNEQSLKLREEQLDVSKDRVQTGEVEVRKDVVEEQKTVNVPVTHEEVYVERRPATDASTGTAPIGDEETIRVPIVEEKVEVTKKPVVTEEIVIGKKQVTETEQVTENVKREEARVDKDGNARVDETTVDPTLRNNNHL